MNFDQTKFEDERRRSLNDSAQRIFTLLCLLSFGFLLYGLLTFGYEDSLRDSLRPGSPELRSLLLLGGTVLFSLLSVVFINWNPFEALYRRKGPDAQHLYNFRVWFFAWTQVYLLFLLFGGIVALVYANRVGPNVPVGPGGTSVAEQTALSEMLEEHTRFMKGETENMETLRAVIARGVQVEQIEGRTDKGRVQLTSELVGPVIVLGLPLCFALIMASRKKGSKKVAVATTFGVGTLFSIGSLFAFNFTFEVPDSVAVNISKPPVQFGNLFALQGSPEFHMTYPGQDLDGAGLEFEQFDAVGPFVSGEHTEVEEGSIEDSFPEIAEFMKKYDERVLFVVGGVDQEPLSPETLKKYGSNAGLAYARAKFVSSRLQEYLDDVPGKTPMIIPLPIDPSEEGEDVAPVDLADDRLVKVFALGAGPYDARTDALNDEEPNSSEGTAAEQQGAEQDTAESQ